MIRQVKCSKNDFLSFDFKSNYNSKMAFDFFNEGIKKQVGAEFTKQEEEFFASKLSILDPKDTTQISIGMILSLFNMTKVSSAIIKKILQSCKVQGKKTLTYDEMKRIFRGISLAQKGIEPSTININANIKLPMPRFYDDDEDSEEEAPVKPNPVKQLKSPIQQQPPQQPKSPTNNMQKQPSFAQFGQFVQTQKLTQQTQKQQQPKQQQTTTPQRSVPAQQEQGTNNKFKEFETYWSKLSTNNNKIDGGQVKNLCKNLAQRSNLSKAWKLCCHTHSGSLTKGEFYVFLEVVSSQQQLPQALSYQMKATIARIDKVVQQNKQKERNGAQFSQLASTQVFDNFGKSQLSIAAPPIPQRPTNQPPSQKPATNLITQTTSRLTSKLQEASKSLKASQQTSQQQLLHLRRQQQAMNNMMGEVQQFLFQVNNKSNKMRAQIEELKNNQSTLNQRFNKVCMAMNQIILRQNAYIQQLVNQLAQQNRVNQQKANVLQRYVEERQAHCQQMERRPIQSFGNVDRVSGENINSPETKAVEVQHPREPEHEHRDEQQKQQNEPNQRHSSPFHQQNGSPEKQRESQREVEHSPQAENQINHQQQQINKQQEKQIQRITMKRMQVIQLIHYLTPISQEEYPKIAQKITAYTEDQLNFAYAGLYEKLLQRQRLQQQQAAEKPVQKGRTSNNQDEFNTSNFRKQQQGQGGQDFFG